MEAETDNATPQETTGNLLVEISQLSEALRKEKEKVHSLQEELKRLESTKQATGNAFATVFKPPNPLLVDIVAQLVGRYLNHKCLATARQVCWKWNECLTPQFANKSEKFLNATSYNLDEINKFSKQLLTVFPLPKPDVSNDIAVGVPSTLSVGINPQKLHRGTLILLQWLKTYGTFIRELELFAKDDSIPVDLFNDVISKCPNLRTFRCPRPFLQGPFPENPIPFPRIENLKIGFDEKSRYVTSTTTSDEMDKTIYASVEYLLSVTPNLKTLTLDICCCNIHNRGSILSTERLSLPSNIENITELSFRNHLVNDSLLFPLSDLGFKGLRKLSLDNCKHCFERPLADPARFVQSLNKFLISVSQTLQQLSLDLNFSERQNPIEEEVSSDNEDSDDDDDFIEMQGVTVKGQAISYIPEMLQLKILEIHSDLESEEGSIDFLQKFPNLETFVLSSKGTTEVLFRLFPNDLQFQHRSLRTLELPQMAIVNRPLLPVAQQVALIEDLSDDEENANLEPLPIATLKIINTCFPSLEVLSISLPHYTTGLFQRNTQILRNDLILLNEYARLTDLKISFGYINDYDSRSCLSKMFVRTAAFGFSGLKRLSFSCCRRNSIMLSSATLSSFRNASSLQYLELNNFLFIEGQKAIQEAVGGLNRVRLVNCRRTEVFLGTRTNGKNFDVQADFEQELGTSIGASIW